MRLATLRRAVTGSAAALALALLGPALTTPTSAVAVPGTVPAPPTDRALPSGWTPRPADHPATVQQRDLAIPMSDGTVLRGDLTLPSRDGRTPVPGTFPVIVTITAYNKTVLDQGAGALLNGGESGYLARRGYAQLLVDARGTGSSEGQWAAFSERENKDAAEVMAWAAQAPFSNGSTGMSGASYMGISQVFAAAGRPPGLKAIFPQVPAGDVYRDVVASGGQLDVGFIPLWLGLVTVTGIIPPAVTATDPESGLTALVDHLAAGLGFSTAMLLDAAFGGPRSYDGPFYAERSPLNVIDRVDVPTFLVSGYYDLFQRGTPMLFDELRRRGVPTKLVIGAWDHLQASSGQGLEDAGYGTLNELQLRWFDHYVKGLPDPALDTDIAPLTWHELGTGEWRRTSDWLGPDRTARTWQLSGSATPGVAPGRLTRGTPEAGRTHVLPIPVQGLCTRSSNQWTAGIANVLPVPNPCLTDNRFNDALGPVFETEPLDADEVFQGPVNVRLHVSSPTGEGIVAVALEDVAPDGTVSRLSGGWQVLSQRAVVPSRSRYLDGELVQPYHPFTKAAKQKLVGVQPVDVEVFPTGARVRQGHRLRVAVQAYDVPHLLPGLNVLLGAALTVVTVHTGPEHPSAVTVPAVR